MSYVQILIGNEEDFEKCLDIRAEGTDENYSELDPASYKQVAAEAIRRFPSVEMVGTTLRNAKSGLLNDWGTLLFDGKDFHLSRSFEDLEIIDRVGGDDSFSSAIIYSLLSDFLPAEICKFAGAYSALAHTFPSGINWATEAEARKAMASGSVRISR